MSVRNWILAVSILGLLTAGAPAWAQSTADPADDGPALTVTDGLTQDQLAKELDDAAKGGDAVFQSYLDYIRSLGLLVFTTPFNEKDGLGDGPYMEGEGSPLTPGSRPTLQGNGLFLRANGLDSQSCNECHNLVSHAERPPHLGIGGVGGVVTNAIIAPSLIDVADSFDKRVQYVAGYDPDLPLGEDGVADFNGRFSNAPFLFGGGGVELVAKEMTKDLEKILRQLEEGPPGVSVSLDTKGIRFGSATKLLDGTIKLDLQGLGLIDLDPEHPLTDAQQIVVRPFGRKGDRFTMRDFDVGAMQFHFGIQPVEAIDPTGPADPDHDGVVNELTVLEMTVLDIFSVTNPPPTEDLFVDSHGKELFKEIGCAKCHQPYFATSSSLLTLSYPEVPEDPDAHVYARINLRRVGFTPDPDGPGVLVPLYSDLKRHDMGPGLAEDMETKRAAVPNRQFITARLWGISDTGPYLHDGRATSIYQAIIRHGGEAEKAREYFKGLPINDKISLLKFLKSLHTPPHPNEDITP
jgi:hypothetical protein